MIYLTGVVLDKNPKAAIIEYCDGLLNKLGSRVCNISRQGSRPYYFFNLVEWQNGVCLNQGVWKRWGRFSNDGSIFWDDGLTPREWDLILCSYPRSLSLILTIGCLPSYDWDDALAESEDSFYRDFEKFFGKKHIKTATGKFFKRRVKEYIENRRVKNLYTCYLPIELTTSEDEVIKQFLWHGKIVVK